MGASLEQRRVEACRLDPRFALDAFADAEAFLADRGMLTLTPSCSLPSLFGACHEEPHSPGKAGYGKYPKTRWWWGGALEATDGAIATKLLKGKTLFLATRVAAIADPLCRDELGRAFAGEHGADAQRVTQHLRAAGPSLTDDVKTELGLASREMQKVRRILESAGAVLTRHLEVEAANGGHRHVGELSLWDQVVPHCDTKASTALRALLVAAVDAAVVVPEKEVSTWFRWKMTRAVVDSAFDARLVRRTDGLLVTQMGA